MVRNVISFEIFARVNYIFAGKSSYNMQITKFWCILILFWLLKCQFYISNTILALSCFYIFFLPGKVDWQIHYYFQLLYIICNKHYVRTTQFSSLTFVIFIQTFIILIQCVHLTLSSLLLQTYKHWNFCLTVCISNSIY